MKTTMGILAGKASHFVLSKLGRGSTLPGKIALKFDKDILDTLAKDYELVLVTGTNGNTSLQVFLSSQIFSVTKWTAMVKSIPLIR